MGKAAKKRIAAKKASKPARVSKASKPAPGKSMASVVSAAKNILSPGKSMASAPSGAVAKGFRGKGKSKSARTMLKKAYDKKARFQIRVGNLGQARKLLRKKATVV